MADGMNDIVEKVIEECAEAPDFTVHRHGGDNMYEVVNDDTGEVAGRYPDRDMAGRVRWQCEQEGEAKAAIRAVLDAIAEPSEAMVEEGAAASGMIQYTHEYKRPITLQDEATTVYRAMIDALRKEIME